MWLKYSFKLLKKQSRAIMVIRTADWFYLIVFLRSKIPKQFVKIVILKLDLWNILLSLNYRISYKRIKLMLHSTFTTSSIIYLLLIT